MVKLQCIQIDWDLFSLNNVDQWNPGSDSRNCNDGY